MKKILFILFMLCFSFRASASAPVCTSLDWTRTLDPDPQWTSASREQMRSDCGTRIFTAIGTTKVSCSRDCSCPSGSTMVKDSVTGFTSCNVNSSSSSSASSVGSSSLPSCDANQVFDTVYGFCRPKVLDPSQCGAGGYAVQVGTAYWCAGNDSGGNSPPDGAQCSLNTPPSGSSYWVCQLPTSGSTSSVSSAATTSTGTSTSSGSVSSSGSGTSSPSTGGNNSASFQNCELTFGVGKCTAISSSNPCPNTYTSHGQTLCVASGFGSSSGSGSSLGSGKATAANCSADPVCTGGDPLQCAFIHQLWINNCDGIEKKVDIDANKDNADIQSEFEDLVNDNKTDLNADGTIKDIYKEVDVSDYADMVSNLNNAASSASSGACPAPRSLHLSFGAFELSYQPLCDLAQSMSYLVLLSFSIFGSLIIYRTVERI